MTGEIRSLHCRVDELSHPRSSSTHIYDQTANKNPRIRPQGRVNFSDSLDISESEDRRASDVHTSRAQQPASNVHTLPNVHTRVSTVGGRGTPRSASSPTLERNDGSLDSRPNVTRTLDVGHIVRRWNLTFLSLIHI